MVPGRLSVTVTFCATLGPVFATTSVYVKVVPATTVSGVTVFRILTSPSATTVVVAVLVLFNGFESGVLTVMTLVFAICVPAATPPLTIATSVIVSIWPAAKEGYVTMRLLKLPEQFPAPVDPQVA